MAAASNSVCKLAAAESRISGSTSVVRSTAAARNPSTNSGINRRVLAALNQLVAPHVQAYTGDDRSQQHHAGQLDGYRDGQGPGAD